MNKLNILKFKVIYNPSLIQKTGELMSRCDLGIEGVEYPQGLLITAKTTTPITNELIAGYKKQIKLFFESEGHRVISIEYINE